MHLQRNGYRIYDHILKLGTGISFAGHHRPSEICSVISSIKRFSTSKTRLSSPLPAIGTDNSLSDAKPFSEIPGPMGLPYIGTMLDYKLRPSTYHKRLLQLHKRYGKIWKETIAGNVIVHLMDPDMIRTVYDAEGKIPHIPPLQETTQKYRKEKEMSLGLGNTNGEEWYRLRSAVQQMMMRPKSVQDFLPLVQEVATEFVERMVTTRDSHDEIPNFNKELGKWNLESSGAVVFFKRLGFLQDQEILAEKMLEANQQIFQLSCDLKFSLPLYKYISTPKWKRLVNAEDFFVGTVLKLIDETVAKVKERIEKKDLQADEYGFITYLLSRSELDDKDVAIIALSLFADGLSTTVPVFIGNLYCLAANPEVQDKVFKEVSKVVPKEGPITTAMLGKLTYLKACVKEAFRFFPVGTEVSRIPQKDFVVGGYHIPAGTHIELNNYVFLRSAHYFEEPDKFLPERWLRDGEGSARNVHPYVLLPFGHGPRMCAGRRFAEQDMWVLIARLLQRYRIEYRHGQMEQIYRLLLRPDKPAQFAFVDR
ncbi:PREDICTED: probable cytochrome P450 CYP44 [Priapulus caudatus]|uniref:Probable cytochrome P450 CYP44 n=1 Tax=Priapulus caudatus TaxID=37621 RepID=A0ABM1DRP1_PRICU|nr:PREDICTED: probable cytochrome P450 CYP44 [Priapulus caudatus]